MDWPVIIESNSVPEPPVLRATDWVNGGPQGQDNISWDTTGDQPGLWIDYGFVLSKIITWGTEHLRVWPAYVWSNPATAAFPANQMREDVGIFGHTIMAARLTQTVGIIASKGAVVPSSLNPDDAADTQVGWIDLNISARQWTPFSLVASDAKVTVSGTDYPVEGT
ncbi:MAG: hypothetical protein EBS05_18335 [Proteobacteria bacterium]|nr:hypothetical protein [Pseudomonadota bacterium]